MQCISCIPGQVSEAKWKLESTSRTWMKMFDVWIAETTHLSASTLLTSAFCWSIIENCSIVGNVVSSSTWNTASASSMDDSLPKTFDSSSLNWIFIAAQILRKIANSFILLKQVPHIFVVSFSFPSTCEWNASGCALYATASNDFKWILLTRIPTHRKIFSLKALWLFAPLRKPFSKISFSWMPRAPHNRHFLSDPISEMSFTWFHFFTIERNPRYENWHAHQWRPQLVKWTMKLASISKDFSSNDNAANIAIWELMRTRALMRTSNIPIKFRLEALTRVLLSELKSKAMKWNDWRIVPKNRSSILFPRIALLLQHWLMCELWALNIVTDWRSHSFICIR